MHSLSGTTMATGHVTVSDHGNRSHDCYPLSHMTHQSSHPCERTQGPQHGGCGGRTWQGGGCPAPSPSGGRAASDLGRSCDTHVIPIRGHVTLM